MLNEDIPLQLLQNEYLLNKGVKLFVLRLDLVHPQISGNKWFKLKYNLEKARSEKYTTILTFGGAYSNHILATAVACNKLGFKSIGIIRGEKCEPLNDRLSLSEKNGMQLHYVSRAEYKNKHEAIFIQDLKNRFGNVFIIPEGGANDLAIEGCSEILKLAKISALKSFNESINFDYVCCACGTGTTMKGILLSLTEKEKIVGIPVLKNADALNQEIIHFIEASNRYDLMNSWEIFDSYHFGGYAKKNKELDEFITGFKSEFNVEIEFVYTGKLFYAVFDKIESGYFNSKQRILVIHTGGVI